LICVLNNYQYHNGHHQLYCSHEKD